MARNTFATIGILAVLLLSFTVVSAAATDNNFTISINGAGESSSNPATGANGELVNFTAQIENNNVDYPLVNLSWSGVDISNGEENDTTGNTTFSPTVEISATGSFHALKVSVTNETGESIANLTVSVYYLDNTTVVIPPTSTNTLCEAEGFDDKGDLEISDFDINNNGEGKDDEWNYLDEIEVIVEIENTNDDENIDDVEVKIVIYDNKIENGGNDVTNDFDIEDEVITSIGKLKDDDQESVTFLIEVPADADDSTYYMYIMTYEDGNESEQCMSESNKLDDDFYFKFSVESVDYDESVTAKGSELDTVINTYCGQQNLEISIPIYNLGSDEEEKVLVNIYNSDLGINEYEIIDDLDNGDKETVNFFIDIPEGLSKEKYDLDITTYFDWDDDEDEDFITAYDEEVSDSSIRLSIISCGSSTSAPSINAALDSETIIGKEIVIKAIVTNNGDDNDFVISASNFESWANLVSVSPQTVSINEGEFEEVTIKLMPTKEGTQSFKINAIVDGESYDQSVSLSVSEKASVFDGIDNAVLYTIIIIVAVLILIFLALIVRVSRRSAKPQF
ncbi:putative S-layer protein [archaeon]|jgi:hypothetical protein|nr:putative S-layer protein [archaeon]